MKILAALVVFTATLAACGPPDTLYDDGSQNAADCPIPSNYSGQSGGPGDPCTNAALDCSPACCECGDGSDSYYASECRGGTCTSDTTACLDAPSSSLCND